MKRDKKRMVWVRNSRGWNGKKNFSFATNRLKAPFMGDGGKNSENKNPARTTNMPRNILKKKASIWCEVHVEHIRVYKRMLQYHFFFNDCGRISYKTVQKCSNRNWNFKNVIRNSFSWMFPSTSSLNDFAFSPNFTVESSEFLASHFVLFTLRSCLGLTS